MTFSFTLILLWFGAYLLGSIPFGLLISRWVEGVDIRKIGSGNIGATNVLRIMGKKWALITLLLDAIKGVIAFYVVYFIIGYTEAVVASVLAVLGHIFPIWLRGKGGKGVATTLAVFWCINPAFGAASAVLWLLTFFNTHYSSLAAIVAMFGMIIITPFMSEAIPLYAMLILSILVIIRHQVNIVRLLKHEEPQSTFKPNSK